MKIIIFKNQANEISFISFAPEMFDHESKTRKDLAASGVIFQSDKEIYDWVASKSVPENVYYDVIDQSILPSDSSFMPSVQYDFTKKKIAIDIVKARSIHLNYLRTLRNQKFIDLGFPYRLNEELESAVISEEMRSKLIELRDMSKNLDLSKAKTIDELKAIIPDYLK